MNAVATAAPRKIENPVRAIAWFPLAVFALVWLEVISRLRFERSPIGFRKMNARWRPAFSIAEQISARWSRH